MLSEKLQIKICMKKSKRVTSAMIFAVYYLIKFGLSGKHNLHTMEVNEQLMYRWFVKLCVARDKSAKL